MFNGFHCSFSSRCWEAERMELPQLIPFWPPLSVATACRDSFSLQNFPPDSPKLPTWHASLKSVLNFILLFQNSSYILGGAFLKFSLSLVIPINQLWLREETNMRIFLFCVKLSEKPWKLMCFPTINIKILQNSLKTCKRTECHFHYKHKYVTHSLKTGRHLNFH